METQISGYEGAEKLLKIWFASSCEKNADLRRIPVEAWSRLLQTNVHCTIVSVVREKHVHAYVLSESSMFVSRKKLILKTCGTSRLLHGLRDVIAEAQRAGFASIAKLTYSRKQFLFSDQQAPTHASFDAEVGYLDDVLGRLGVACQFGRVNRTSSWNFYVNHGIDFADSDSQSDSAVSDSDKSEVESENESANASESENESESEYGMATGPCFTVPETKQSGDQTLEVLMTNLDPSVMRVFTRQLSDSAEMATRTSGIDTIFRQATIDDFLFDPCGYSMNGLMDGGKYFTIHITPEDAFSYVSFETSATENCGEVVQKVVDLFKPRDFIVTLTSDKLAFDGAHMELLRETLVDGFDRELAQVLDAQKCGVSYACFHRDPF